MPNDLLEWNDDDLFKGRMERMNDIILITLRTRLEWASFISYVTHLSTNDFDSMYIVYQVLECDYFVAGSAACVFVLKTNGNREWVRLKCDNDDDIATAFIRQIYGYNKSDENRKSPGLCDCDTSGAFEPFSPHTVIIRIRKYCADWPRLWSM